MRDARVLVLDEPTSALDAQAEYELFERLRKLTEARTAVYISHRFSTVRRADRILFLERGQLVEEGSHEELMALAGRYARLFHMQASAYTGEPVEAQDEPGEEVRLRRGALTRASAGTRVPGGKRTSHAWSSASTPVLQETPCCGGSIPRPRACSRRPPSTCGCSSSSIGVARAGIASSAATPDYACATCRSRSVAVSGTPG